jgi:hypothetical protein
MNTQQGEEEEAVYDGDSMVLSSGQTAQNTISARRKMWGEDGNGARRIKLRPY